METDTPISWRYTLFLHCFSGWNAEISGYCLLDAEMKQFLSQFDVEFMTRARGYKKYVLKTIVESLIKDFPDETREALKEFY